MYIYEHLSWVNHNHQVKSRPKFSKTCGILTKLKYLLLQSVLLTIYNTRCLPYLQYCPIIWAGSSSSILMDILNIQKRTVVSICQCKARTHSDPLFTILGLMKINDIYTQQFSSFMYKYNANMLPINFINNYTKNSAVHVHSTSSLGVLITSINLFPFYIKTE